MSALIDDRVDLALPQFLRTEPGTELGSDSPSMNVTVIATNGRGTIAALRAAEKLAANLGASIALVKAQIIPFEFPLEDPPVSIDFLQRQLYGLVCEAGIEAQKITVRLWLCRDRFVGLRKILRPRSLVVIGGRKRWWSREKALERFLSQAGHQVVFIDPGAADRHEARSTPWSESAIPVLKQGVSRRDEQ
jgi:hypothetical protein